MPPKTASLVSQPRKAALERDRGFSYGDGLIKRDKIRRSSSLSSMLETTSEYSEYPMRSSIESLNDDNNIKTCKRIERSCHLQIANTLLFTVLLQL